MVIDVLCHEETELTPEEIEVWAGKILTREFPSHTNIEISILVTSEDEMASLNRTYRDEPMSTDVLSFPQLEDDEELTPESVSNSIRNPAGEEIPVLLGDVVLCPAEIRRRSASGESFLHAFVRTLAHGILHLLGYDHPEGADQGVMASYLEKLTADLFPSAGPN